MKQQLLPIISKSEILKTLKSNKMEEVDTIKRIEADLKKKRKHVFKMPKPGSAVIVMLSGGLDSTTVCDMLMRRYKLHVYPLYLRRGQIRMPIEEKSIREMSTYFSKEFPTLYHEPQIINAFIPPLEFRFDVTQYAESEINKNTKQWQGVPMYTSLASDYAVNYAVYLERTGQAKTRTILFGIMKNDGLVLKYETLTFLRLATYHICNVMGDYSWQISSLPIEKELGFFFDKEVLHNWCKHFEVPIYKTFSCLDPHYFHCGHCFYCRRRQKTAAALGIQDETFYMSNVPRFKRLVIILDKLLYSMEYLGFFYVINKNFLRYFLKYYFGR